MERQKEFLLQMAAEAEMLDVIMEVLEALAAAAAVSGVIEVRLVVAVVILEALEHQILASLAAVVPITHPAQMRPVKKALGRVTVRWLLPIVLVSALNLRQWFPIIIM
jgi:hypothetical protein